MWFLAGNNLEQFSAQQLVSCVTDTKGCDGGDPTLGFEYVQSYVDGIALESDYPYSDESSVDGNTPHCARLRG